MPHFNNSGSNTIKVIEEEPLMQNNRIKKGRITHRYAIMAMHADYAFESAGLGIWSYDFESKVLKICKRCKKLIGIPESQVASMDLVLGLLPRDEVPAIFHAIRAVWEKGGSLDYQFPLLSGSAVQQRWLAITGISVSGFDSKATKLYGTLADVSANRNLENSRRELLSLISHEMKSPLSSIKLYVQLSRAIALKMDDLQIVKFLTSANDMVDKANNLLDYFLKGPNSQTGRMPITKTAFNIQALLREVVDEVQIKHPEHQLILRPAPGIMIQADRDRIGEVVNNLLINAIKYSPEPDAIVISCKMSGGRLQVSVKDHGIGIPNNEHCKIFDKYYRVANKLEKAITGYGIGLYLCKNIIDEHEGTIWFKSEANKGSTFFFCLPV
ncbi:sensor histidine kinase [Mucilaginibacter celer]|uniref:histidine kinase n=1 Tax=Mucilaginibacter celer TaxID=2305508 RepID=A0A494VWL8_9SPHI|nr:HAMP domain-containing sensor histidine kinase [Mucilaginibacter celer]AYL95382.1 sensor histidine kinase [Mucilaginibacter celer]